MEIGNSKMDAAVLGEPGSASQMIETGAAPVTLLQEDLLGLFNHLLVLEATWLAGNSILQTVYACLYMLDMERYAQLLWEESSTGGKCPSSYILSHTLGC
jgi:hypothetical protein